MIFPFSIFVVQEESMVPTYGPSDHVVTFNWGKMKVGDVIVFIDKNNLYIKRIEKISVDKVFVAGDNKVRSSNLGPVEKSKIIGRVIFKY